MTEKILDHTREEWQMDMMRLDRVAGTMYEVQAQAAQDGMVDVQQEVMEDLKSIQRAKVLLELLLQEWGWKEEARPTQ